MLIYLKSSAAVALVLVSTALLPTTRAGGLGGVAAGDSNCVSRIINFENAEDTLDCSNADNKKIPSSYGDEIGITFRITDHEHGSLTLDGETLRPQFERSGSQKGDGQSGFWGNAKGSHDSLVDSAESMDKYFLRTYALGSDALNNVFGYVPSLFISYTGDGTTSASGEIYDIDGNGYAEGHDSARLEEWTMIAYDSDMRELGRVVSPRGTVETIRSQHSTRVDAMGNSLRIDKSGQVSYDSTNWYWAINANNAVMFPEWPNCGSTKCAVNYIEIRYTGVYPADRPSSVALAFDNFAAFACLEHELEMPEPEEWSEWSKWDSCDVQDLERCGQEGYQRSTRTKNLADNEAAEELQSRKCGNWEPCPPCGHGEFGEWSECEFETCGSLGIKTRTKVSLPITNYCIPPAPITEEGTCQASTCCHLPIDFEDAIKDNSPVAIDRYLQDKYISFRSITTDCDVSDKAGIDSGACDVIAPGGAVSQPQFEASALQGNDGRSGFVGSASKGRDAVVDASVPLDNWFLRTYDLGSKTWDTQVGFVPTLLISYNTYTLAASGHIYDIDGSSWDSSKSSTRQEQWRITAWGYKDGEYVALKTIDSPRGNSNALRSYHATAKDAVGNPLRMKVRGGREIVSYDSANWEWKFNAATDEAWPQCEGDVPCAVSDITIAFIGQFPEGRPTSVGLAFDNFDAFGCSDPEAPTPPEPPVPCQMIEFTNGTECSTTACGTEGTYTDARELIRENNCFAPHNVQLTRQGSICLNDPCECTYTEFDEGVCSVNKDEDGCGAIGVYIKYREVKYPGSCPYLEDETVPGAEMELRRKEKLEQITTDACSAELCPCDIMPFEGEFECSVVECGLTGSLTRTTGYEKNTSCLANDTLYEEYHGVPPVFVEVSLETCFTPCNCTAGEWSDPVCSTEETTCGSVGVWYQTRLANPDDEDCIEDHVSTYREVENMDEVAEYNEKYGSCSAAPCCKLTEYSEPECSATECGITSNPNKGTLTSTRKIDTSVEGCINGDNINAEIEFTQTHGECTAPTCDCVPSEWSNWVCSADELDCGNTGTTSRQRTYTNIDECKMPEGALAKYIAIGEDNRAEETVPGPACATADCCAYSPWVETCEAATCGEPGRLVKRRTFDQGGNNDCAIPDNVEEELVETGGSCDLRMGDWTAWSECECGQESERFACYDPEALGGRRRQSEGGLQPFPESRQTRMCCECTVGTWSELAEVSACDQVKASDSESSTLVIACSRADDTSVTFTVGAESSTTVTEQPPANAQETLAELDELLSSPDLTVEEREQAEAQRNTLRAGVQCSTKCSDLGTQECTEDGLAPINYARERGVVDIVGEPQCPALKEACLCPCEATGDDNTALIAGLASAGAAVLLAAAGAVMYFTNSAGAAQATANSGDMFNDLQNQHNPMFENPTNVFYNENYAPGVAQA
ncbi:hypothetical protein SARC_06066 [Sphaeroforma arctica JP610]|uniref:TSP C-terminal domain-containing protein n=1 Tax=Sphaeroforma arctica JP610 TaxID=667725 RepID=A0A0L0FXR0_9EUKA|nr:hypothetical protein SARC_06066 [Sphaeroforma arctica JP610]KNC81610.1 hypothetical protein SARC_06066 [Sphaeroforma arctica JP610]|eukprot:XP_014155512.1 hypothetical protein SARC_06066 [Sphaeroforma arctica JP610]